jgi:2-hydroxychromene-2-carboxylate isomerase
MRDCRRLAGELGIPFLDKGSSPPVEHRRALLDVLAGQAQAEDFSDSLLASIGAYWRGDAEGVARRAARPGDFGSANVLLETNQRRLRKLGHYNSATLHYGGEWYWGVDRLHYLVTRLDDLGIAREPGLAPRIASIRQVMQPNLPVTAPAAARSMPPVELFYSFRSPYSWLLLQRLYRIADAFSVPVVVRPVLPMVMRGMRVPAAKLRYMGFDASREARQHGVAFGKMADPVGSGVERCMAVWNYARQEKREREFLESAGNAIWARGVDVATDTGLRAVGTKAGLFWPEVLAALDDDAWREIAEDNRAALSDSGCWGVPTVRIGDWVTWGQDRDWLVARHLEELCDNGDGIVE